jgi:tRNA pseudouridine13 synthase
MFITKSKPLHARVKQRYSDFIVEEIYEENGEEKTCKVQRFTIPWEQRDKPAPMVIPENKENKEHLIVELEKINTDTNKAIALIARGTGVSKTRVGYGGLKDKRGITAQRMSLYQPNVERLINFGVKGLELRNPKWGERLELGDLVGNQFNITLRDIDQSEEEIKQTIDDFSKGIVNGVPNFFGTQRFGGKRMVTHKVGKLLIKEEYKDAMILYLTHTFEEEKEDIKTARINLAKTMDFKKALIEFPRECRSELAILNKLARDPTDFVGAFSELPKQMRYLFVHAYQSHIFNRIIEKRIEMYGDKALSQNDGDIVNEEGIVLGLLPGYESKFSTGSAGEVEKEILKEEEIKFGDFKVNRMSELSSQGNRKEISLFPKNFKLEKIMDDEFNPGKKAIVISFFLGKGNYATTVLRELIKEEIF